MPAARRGNGVLWLSLAPLLSLQGDPSAAVSFFRKSYACPKNEYHQWRTSPWWTWLRSRRVGTEYNEYNTILPPRPSHEYEYYTPSLLMSMNTHERTFHGYS